MSQTIIGVVGATGVVGRQVLNALLAKDVEPEDVRFYASERSAGEDLDYGDEGLPVEPVDCTGAFRLDAKVPLVSPGLNDGVLDREFAGRVVSIAHPATQAALAALNPLREKWGLALADLTILGGAALFGQAGVDRLSRQTAELMNGKDPELDTCWCPPTTGSP
jgi:aspartate-semialdehyde dehydrogenase